MQLLEARITEPSGVCFLCELAEDGPYIDIQRNHLTDFCNLNGVKQVCFGCASEIAKLIGFVDPASFAAMLVKVEVAEKAVEEADAMNVLANSIAKAQEFVVSHQKPIKR